MLGSTATSATSAIAPITAFGLARPRLTARASHDQPVAGPIACVDMTALLRLRCGCATMATMLLHRLCGPLERGAPAPPPRPSPACGGGGKRWRGKLPPPRAGEGWGGGE